MSLAALDHPPLAPSAPPPLARPRPARTVAHLVLDRARQTPERAALVLPGRAGGDLVVRYGELAGLAAGYARGLRAAGLGAGDRVFVLAPPSAEFYGLALGVLAGGMTLVLADGRLTPGRVLAALGDAGARAVVGPPALVRWWPLVPALRRARRFTTGGRVLGARSLAALGRADAAERVGAEPAGWLAAPAHAPAVISFTSGSAGRAKGVVRTHAVLLAQHEALRAVLPARAGDVHLTSLPLAALHAMCCGGTAVLAPAVLAPAVLAPAQLAPAYGAARADVPAALAALLARRAVTSVSGAPAFVAALAEGVLAGDAGGAPGVGRVVVGGAPVSRRVCALVRRAFPAAAGHVVYGATEAEPIAAAAMDEVEGAAGPGFLVGRPAAGTGVALVAPGAPVPDVARPLAAGDEGEVVVRGPHVTARRLGDAPNDAAAGGWHRTGDLARVDARGRLWLVGGVGAAVEHGGRPLRPFEVEAEALAHPDVRAAGLVAHRRAPDGELAVELAPGADGAAVTRALRARLDALELPALPLRVVARVPVDARHASKVQRAELARLLARPARAPHPPAGSAR